jgi:hypothetical protein
MRIRIWNAYASNNSGSYTIVGVFPDAASAAAAAEELRELCRAETEWAEASTRSDEEPLVQFARAHGHVEESAVNSDVWPMYPSTAPDVVVAGRRLIVHHPQTITLPALLGAHVYKRGGRVETEIEHAHHAVVADCRISARFNDPDRAAKCERIAAELAQPGSVLHRHSDPAVAPIVRHEVDMSWSFVRAWIALDDESVVRGLEELASVVARHGCELEFRLSESPGGRDPLHGWRRP